MPFFVLLTVLLSVLVSLTIKPETTYAAPSSTLNFQGRLTTNTGGLVPDGSYNIEFKIYDDALAGTNLWTETRTGGTAVTVRNGYFSVYLGEVTPFGSSIPWDQELWMTMNVNSDGEMSPRFKLTAVPYAFRAGAITDAAGNAFTGDDFAQIAPSNIQAVNSALAALRFNQTGAGGLLQLQGNGSDVFTVDNTGGTTLGAGITVGNSTSTTAGTVRWTGTDLEVYNGSAWVSLTSGSGGSGTLAYDAFYAYDAAGDIDVSAGWTDITLDTEVKEDTPYTHATDAAAVTIGEDGWYEISYNISGYTNAGGNSQSTLGAKLQENTGGGFTDISGSFGHAAIVTGQSDGNIAVTLLRQFTAGDIVKLQAQRAAGDAITILTRANSAGLTIKKFVDAGSGGGGSGTSFEQNGNAFGTTAILGTTDANGLNIITNNATALSFTSGGAATFTNGVTISSGGLGITGDITATSGLTLASGGSGDLTLDSASGIIALSADSLQRSGTGTTTIDLFDASGGTTLQLLNSDGTQVAGLSVEGGITAASFSGSGSGLTALNASAISSGTISDLRLSSNVALLDQNQTFNGTPTFNTGLVLGNSTSTTTGAVRWSGTDFEGYDGIQWVSLTQGSSSGGGSPVAATFYDSTGGASIASGVFSTINLDATLDNSDATIVDVANDVVTVAEDGYYEISYQVTTRLSSGTRSGFNAKLQLDTGSGFADVAGSQAYHYGRVTTETSGTSSATVILNLSAGDSIRIQGAGTTQSFTTIADATNLSIAKITEAAAGGGGGSGTSFEQGGNSFGATGVLGTLDTNNLNLVANGSTGLSLTTSGQALFSYDVVTNGSTTLGNDAGDGLTIVSGNVTLTNGLNFDSGTIFIDSANNRVGIGTSTTTNLLTINDATTADAAAQILLATEGATNKGLVIQTSVGQTASALEIQNSSGTVLAGFNASGGLVLGLSTVTSSATANRSIVLPDASGTICLSGSASCGYIQFASGSFQTDASTANTIAINKTNATGSLVSLQRNGASVFTVDNTGGLQIQSTQTTALDVRNTSGTSFFSVDTNNGFVRIGPATADNTGVLLVLDTKNTAGDPTGTEGGIYYNSNLGKFRCFENGEWKDCIGTRQIRSFVDNTTNTVVDANTTDYWDTAAENNNIHPNLTPSATNKAVLGTVSVQISAGTSQDRTVVTRVERGIGSVPTCGTGTVVGFYASTFTTNTGDIITSTISFLDTPATTSQVFYTLCSDSNTSSAAGMSVDKIRMTLEEANNSN